MCVCVYVFKRLSLVYFRFIVLFSFRVCLFRVFIGFVCYVVVV